MIRCKLSQVVDFAIDHDPAVLRRGMFGHLRHSDLTVTHVTSNLSIYTGRICCLVVEMQVCSVIPPVAETRKVKEYLDVDVLGVKDIAAPAIGAS
jgi:hypothetical protein